MTEEVTEDECADGGSRVEVRDRRDSMQPSSGRASIAFFSFSLVLLEMQALVTVAADGMHM